MTASPSPDSSGSSEFGADTAVRPTGAGRWSATLHDRWNIGANPNGRYLLAVAVRAMSEAVERPQAMSVTAHYLAPTNVGPVEIITDIVKAGRSFASVEAAVVQDGRERVRLLGTFGDLAAQRGPTRITATSPRIAPPEECRSLLELTEAAGRPAPEALHRFDIRLPAVGAEPSSTSPTRSPDGSASRTVPRRTRSRWSRLPTPFPPP